MKKITLAKLIIASLLWFGYHTLEKFFRPVMTSQMALGQMESSNANLVAMNMHSSMWQYGFIAVTLVTIFIFWKEIKQLIGKFKGEK